MAKSFLTPITLNQLELQNARIQNLASAPSSPVSGQIYYDTTQTFTLVYNGSAWIDARARANHSGTQLSATISDLATTVQAYHLNQFAVPTANIPMGGFTLTGLNTAPSASGQAAEYSWVVGRNLNTIATATANTANVPMGGYTLTGLSTAPSASGQAAEYSWVLSRPLSAFSGTVAANIPMGGFTFTGLATPTASGQAAEYSWVLSRPLSAFTGTVAANIPMGGYTFTGLATPTAAGQAAEYSWVVGQVQSAAAGISSKDPVAVVSVANVASLSGLPTTDGVTLVANQRILLTAQTTASQNGPYVVSAGAWTRPVTEGGAQGELDLGAMWLVTQGTTYAGSQWRLATTGTITVGTTSVSIVQFSAGSAYSAGNGISLVGSVFSANVLAAGGVLNGGTGLYLDTTIAARKYSATIGDGSTTAIVVTHSLGTQDVIMACRLAGTPYTAVECDMAATSTTTATFTFAVAPAVSAYRVTVLG